MRALTLNSSGEEKEKAIAAVAAVGATGGSAGAAGTKGSGGVGGGGGGGDGGGGGGGAAVGQGECGGGGLKGLKLSTDRDRPTDRRWVQVPGPGRALHVSNFQLNVSTFRWTSSLFE